MRQCDIIRFLFRDLKESTSQLIMGEYHNLFEEEIQEHYPFEDQILNWLNDLYKSEKYDQLEGADRSLLFEKAHPFLFVRDLATMNSWRFCFFSKERKDQITGLMFSMTPEVALESTLCLCQPTMIQEPVSQWFDANQAMKNLEYDAGPDRQVNAWKACAYFYLYIHFTSKDHPAKRDELVQMLSPFMESLDWGTYHGDDTLKEQCEVVQKALKPMHFRTMVDSFLSV